MKRFFLTNNNITSYSELAVAEVLLYTLTLLIRMTPEVWSGNQGTLSVFVSKAKDLPNLNKLDKQNVMLRLRVAHMTRESDILLRAGQNPVFKYLEKYEITPEVKPTMQVEVYCERKKKAPLIIGRCEVDLLNGIRADPKEGYCSWYDLKREKNEFAGTIFIELTFTPSLPHFQRETRSEEIERLDASMVCRPVPPLPGNSSELLPPIGHNYEDVKSHYMHASAMRDATPSMNNKGHSFADSSSTTGTNELHINLSSSIGTNNTAVSQETSETAITATSDTRFHFANLKRLKEKINVFKNPTNSMNNYHSDTPVDIEALQKAIGVASLDDEENDDIIGRHGSYASRVSQNTKLNSQPPLPPLPTENTNGIDSRSSSVRMPPLPRSHSGQPRKGITPPLTYEDQWPRLPPMPKSPYSRSSSASPKRRPPPEKI